MKEQEYIREAAACIRNGGVILCPTDTIWGLSADSRNHQAVEQIFQLKNRPKNKSVIVLVSSLNMLRDYVESIPEIALKLLNKATRPTSVIYPKAKGLAENVVAANGSIGIRIVHEGFVHHLVEELGFPIVSTSANISGEDNPKGFESINKKLIEGVDLVVDIRDKTNTETQASSIYLIAGNELQQLR